MCTFPVKIRRASEELDFERASKHLIKLCIFTRREAITKHFRQHWAGFSEQRCLPAQRAEKQTQDGESRIISCPCQFRQEMQSQNVTYQTNRDNIRRENHASSTQDSSRVPEFFFFSFAPRVLKTLVKFTSGNRPRKSSSLAHEAARGGGCSDGGRGRAAASAVQQYPCRIIHGVPRSGSCIKCRET